MQQGDVANSEQIDSAPCLDTIVDNTEISSLISKAEEAVERGISNCLQFKLIRICENKTKLCSKLLG